MFIDDVKIFVKGGKGGNGAVAFRREKYEPLGGPAGGDGGKGGSVIFVGDEGLTTLLDFRYQKHIVAPDGENGKPKNCGWDGDIRVKVPVGSVVTDLQPEPLADITQHGQAVSPRRQGAAETPVSRPRYPPGVC